MQLIYNAELVSAVQQSDSVIHVSKRAGPGPCMTAGAVGCGYLFNKLGVET